MTKAVKTRKQTKKHPQQGLTEINDTREWAWSKVSEVSSTHSPLNVF